MLLLPTVHHSCSCSCPSELLSNVLLSPPWQEWMDEVRSLLAFLETDKEADENDSDKDHAVRALQAVYGEGAENRTYDELVKAKPAITIPHSRVIDLKTAEVRTWQLSRAAHPLPAAAAATALHKPPGKHPELCPGAGAVACRGKWLLAHICSQLLCQASLAAVPSAGASCSACLFATVLLCAHATLHCWCAPCAASCALLVGGLLFSGCLEALFL